MDDIGALPETRHSGGMVFTSSSLISRPVRRLSRASLAAMLGAAALIAASPVPAAEARGQYDTYLLLHRVGAETFIRSGDVVQGGRLSITSRLSDRGAMRAATTEVEFGPALEVTRLESQREGAPTPTAAFATHDGKAQAQEGGVTRAFARPAVASPARPPCRLRFRRSCSTTGARTAAPRA